MDNGLYKGRIIDVGTDEDNKDTYHKVKVRIPSVHGGTNSPRRVPDEYIRWSISTLEFTKDDIGSVVILGRDDDDMSKFIVIGRLWI